MPSVYDKSGLRLLYPDNWTLDEDTSGGAARSVTVQSPGGAFWSIAVHDPAADPRELAHTALEALKQEYADFDAEPVTEELANQPVGGFDFRFFYLDFTNTATIRAFRTPTATCLVLCQAEDREFEQLAQVFRAITTSVLSPGAIAPQ